MEDMLEVVLNDGLKRASNGEVDVSVDMVKIVSEDLLENEIKKSEGSVLTHLIRICYLPIIVRLGTCVMSFSMTGLMPQSLARRGSGSISPQVSMRREDGTPINCSYT